MPTDPYRAVIGLGRELSERVDKVVDRRTRGLPQDGAFAEARRRERQATIYAALALGVRELEYQHGIRRRQETEDSGAETAHYKALQVWAKRAWYTIEMGESEPDAMIAHVGPPPAIEPPR